MNNNKPNLLGEDPAFTATLRAASLVAATDTTVLISGESGTGKEQLAHYIHQHSRRRDQAFITVNCAALPESLIESELFGHRKGAFTGATTEYSGLLGAADGGSVLLDEIGELPLAMQGKLLRYLESGECQMVGESRPHRVDTRVIAASHRDLSALVQQGLFRADLYYRLNIVPLEMPALRNRSGDIRLLLEQLLRLCAQRHRQPAPRFSKTSLVLLGRYPWPGNIRELRNLCERMAVLYAGQLIQPEHLPSEISSPVSTASTVELPAGGLCLETVEIDLIRQALQRTAGNRSQAARLLGLSRDTLLYRLKKYALA